MADKEKDGKPAMMLLLPYSAAVWWAPRNNTIARAMRSFGDWWLRRGDLNKAFQTFIAGLERQGHDWEKLAYDAMVFGATKYAEHNYISDGGLPYSDIASAFMRHMLKAGRHPESTASDSHLLHLAHAMADLHMLVTYEALKVGVDDRPVVPGVSQ